MKIRYIGLIGLAVLAFFVIREKPVQPTISYSIPDANIMAIGTELESAYLHPNHVMAWLDKRRPSLIWKGQVSHFTLKGVHLAVSAPHVVDTIGWQHRLPKIPSTEGWIHSSDGREVSFALLRDSKSLGFQSDPVEVMAPKHGIMAIFSASIVVAGESRLELVPVTVEGPLRIITDQVELSEMAVHFKTGNPESNISQRMNTRAPGKYIMTIDIDPAFYEYLPGLSGTIVWQEGRPVGIFVARTKPDGVHAVAIVEPLLDAAEVTLPKIR